MKNILALILVLLVTPHARAAVGGVIGGGGGTSLPGRVVTVAPGTSLSLILSNAVANTVYQLGAGTYPVTPGAVFSNAVAGISIFNKTNISIRGVPGQTIINGLSGLGEHLWMTNCSNVVISGLTFLGLVQTNPAPTVPSVVHSIVGYYACADLLIEDCSFLGMHDHGIGDAASQPNWNTPSTNGIVIRNNFFRDGGTYFNFASYDGTAIVPTGGLISGNVIRECGRGIEPYIENDATPTPIYHTIIEGNTLINILDAGVLSAGSTNCNNVIVRNNSFRNEIGYTRRGTNVMNMGPVGVYWNGGLGWKITGNDFYGAWAVGIYAGQPGGVQPVGDGLIANNTFEAITNTANAAIPIKTLTLYRTPITGNHMTGAKTLGIYALGLRDSEISNNQLINPAAVSGVGIRLATFSPDVTSNVLVRGNYISDFVAGRLLTGIDDQLGGLFKVSLLDNTILNATTKVLNLSGDQMFVAGPPAVFNFTNDVPSLAAGGSWRTNFPASGTKSNDLVQLMVPSPYFVLATNVITTAWASNDSVWIYTHNSGPAAVDPANVRYKAIVQQVEP